MSALRHNYCGFMLSISAGVYENRLTPADCTIQRSIQFTGPRRRILSVAGLVYVPVPHDGNVYQSDEEVSAIKEIVEELCGHTLHDGCHAPRRLSEKDVLVVALFNLQVRKLQSALPGVRVGTVNKFQGQEAPVVIFSMTSSEGDAAARGVDFLFDKHRLNVAISRAQILAVVVACPNLKRTRCTSLEQMAMVNLFCRAVHENEKAVETAGG